MALTPLHNIEGLPVPPARLDSVTADSLASLPREGMVLPDPIIKESAPRYDALGDGVSWVLLVLSALFCAIALKFKNNVKFLSAVASDLYEVRERHNAFDDTVRETSFLILLNVMWVCCAGVLLWQTVALTAPLVGMPEAAEISPGKGITVGIGMAALYMTLMNLAYLIVGNVFSDGAHTGMWIKGAAASQGFEVILLFPLALLTLCYEPWTLILLEIAAVAFILGKIIFIFKGFRIFFNQSSSWLLFLYYLCSLEIVPLILTYLATLRLCGMQW